MTINRAAHIRRAVMVAGAATIALIVASCGGDGSRVAHATVRDSAGVQIVENSAPAWPTGSGWRLSAKPVVSIGVVEGDPHYQLDRVAGATRLSDGRIVIANTGSSELRYYDSTGTYLLTSGRTGGGPGEFKRLVWIARLPGDSVLAYDRWGARFSVLDPQGQLAGSPVSFPKLAGLSPLAVGRFAGGAVAMRDAHGYGPGQEKSGVASYPIVLLRVDMQAVSADTIGSFPGSQEFLTVTENSMTISSLPFGRSPVMAVHGAMLYYGSSDRYEIGAYTPDGTLRRSIRLARENMPVTQSDIDALIKERMERLGSAASAASRANFRRRYTEMPYPAQMPAYRRLMIDAEGDLWVQDYLRPTDTQPRWMVFDSTGQMLGAVTMPARFRALEIGTDYVLGEWRDALDVEHVQLYGLEKAVETGDDRTTIDVGSARREDAD